MSNMETMLRLLKAAEFASRQKGVNVPPIIWGSPGEGKTALVESYAAHRDAWLKTIILSQMEPADVNGAYMKADRVAADGTNEVIQAHALPQYAVELRDVERGILFFDELSTANPSSQAASLRIFREKVIADQLKLHDGIFIIAAANDADEAADGWELAPPVANRFMHLNWKPDDDAWFRGMTLGFDTLIDEMDLSIIEEPTPERIQEKRVLVASYVKKQPNHKSVQPDVSDPAAGKAWPSPRTWEMLATILAYIPDNDDEVRQLAAIGLVGEGVGIEFLTWLSNSNLPDPIDVLENPNVYDWNSTRSDLSFAVMSSVTATYRRFDEETRLKYWDNIIEVIKIATDNSAGDVVAPFLMDIFSQARPKGAKIPKELAATFKNANLVRSSN